MFILLFIWALLSQESHLKLQHIYRIIWSLEIIPRKTFLRNYPGFYTNLKDPQGFLSEGKAIQ